MRKLLLAAIGLAALAGACGLAQAQDHQGPPGGGRLFDRYDTDHNGVVTRQEFDAVRAADFTRLDTNHDGQLSHDEMRAGFREMFHGGHGHGPGGFGGGMLARADANHDGNITRAEFLAKPTEMFDRLDKNHDGVISADELQQDRAEMQQHRDQWRQAHAQDHANRPNPDTNGDGMISRAEYDAMGAAMFQHLDANSDGQVTQAEAEAARPHHGP